LAPHLLKYDYIEPSIFGLYALRDEKKDTKAAELGGGPIRDVVDDYYRNDAISRSSVIMAKAAAAFNPHKFSSFPLKTFN
jgi:NADH dehydrogenase (ubiquinone) Fe-S protein 1